MQNNSFTLSKPVKLALRYIPLSLLVVAWLFEWQGLATIVAVMTITMMFISITIIIPMAVIAWFTWDEFGHKLWIEQDYSSHEFIVSNAVSVAMWLLFISMDWAVVAYIGIPVAIIVQLCVWSFHNRRISEGRISPFN